jgi:hypothetical protein
MGKNGGRCQFGVLQGVGLYDFNPVGSRTLRPGARGLPRFRQRARAATRGTEHHDRPSRLPHSCTAPCPLNAALDTNQVRRIKERPGLLPRPKVPTGDTLEAPSERSGNPQQGVAEDCAGRPQHPRSADRECRGGRIASAPPCALRVVVKGKWLSATTAVVPCRPVRTSRRECSRGTGVVRTAA